MFFMYQTLFVVSAFALGYYFGRIIEIRVNIKDLNQIRDKLAIIKAEVAAAYLEQCRREYQEQTRSQK